MQRVSILVIAFAVIALAMNAAAAEQLPVLATDDFEHGNAKWQTTDPDPTKLSWEIVDLKNAAGKPTKAFRVTGKSAYQPKFRSPPNFALLGSSGPLARPSSVLSAS